MQIRKHEKGAEHLLIGGRARGGRLDSPPWGYFKMIIRSYSSYLSVGVS